MPIVGESFYRVYIYKEYTVVYTTQPRLNDVSPGINRCGRVKINLKFRP
jgi:hypothetical protein